MRQIRHITLLALLAMLLTSPYATNTAYAQDEEKQQAGEEQQTGDKQLETDGAQLETDGTQLETDGAQLETDGEELQIIGKEIVPEAGYVPTKSPWGAVLRSALLPGLGQFYNEAYWKIPIVVSVTGLLVYGYSYENNNFKYYSDLYDNSITEEDPEGNLTLKRYREFYRDNRDSYATWIVITYLLQIADAFVDAHLYDFDVSDEVQGSVSLGPGTLNLQLRW